MVTAPGWETVLIGEICKLTAAPAKRPNGSRYVILDMGSVTRDGSLLSHKRTDDSSDLLHSGDLVMPKDDIGGGKIIGKAVLVPEEGRFVLGDHVYRLRLERGCPAFVRYAINSNEVNRALRSKVVGSAQLGLGRSSVLEQVIPFPPLEEQEAIAEALSDADSAIEALDALIAKKRDVKQAAMQQLLTGRTRLPGFSGNWIPIAYNELTTHRSGNGSLIKGKLDQSRQGGKYQGFSASGPDIWCDFAEYSGLGLVISAVGSRCGKVFRADGEWTAIANTHVLFADQKSCDTDFLWRRVNDEDFWVKGGTGQPFVLVKETLKRVDDWPQVDEQRAIAEVLSHIDTEINALASERDKTQLVKQGMMQELLTGRVRLI